MNRDEMIARLQDQDTVWDLLIVGGGATGVGTALDAATRGYRVALVEQSDFGKGTSSRSTKLVHGGVRYLQQGHLPLVFEALRERGRLYRNAPHLVHDLKLIVPAYGWRDRLLYSVGMKLYDVLAGRLNPGRSRSLSPSATLDLLPTLRPEELRGGVLFHDGQFDDARLLLELAATAVEQGATLANYVQVVGLTRRGDGTTGGAVLVDREAEREWTVRAKVVVNATGPFADSLRRLDDPGTAAMIAPSQGAHVVLDRSFLPSDTALLVPRTRDGRVMFAIPWQGVTLVGTTDTPVGAVSLEPRPLEAEVDFLLETTAEYLTKQPTRGDVRSMFAGIRPLVRDEAVAVTSKLARDHVIRVSQSGVVTIAGGKWTTYRHMAEHCVDRAAGVAGLERRPCVTRDLRVHGWTAVWGHAEGLGHYGAHADAVQILIRSRHELANRLDPRLPYRMGEVIWSARHEMARTVDDVLARRTRSLVLDAQAALDSAARVAELLASELQRDERWQREQTKAFHTTARQYLISGDR